MPNFPIPLAVFNFLPVALTGVALWFLAHYVRGQAAANDRLALLCAGLILAGGLIGIALGVGGAMVLQRVMSLQALISPLVVAIAVGFSALVGVVFGLYPAYKASRLDPIEALRYE